MNLSRIKILCEKRPGGLRKIAADIGMSEANLHRCISKNRIQSSDLEKLAKLLNVSISTFFDEEPQTQKAITNGDGNNVTQIGQINNSHIDARQYHSDSPDVLRSEIDKLDMIIAEKEARISEKDKQISEKDKQISALIAAISK